MQIRMPNIAAQTQNTHGIAYRESLQKTKPIVYEKIQSFLNGMNDQTRICSIDIAYDWSCNLRCDHCFATSLEDRSGTARKFNLDRMKKVADEADALGAFSISLQGGEPLFWENLFDVIEVIDPKRFNLSIVTNGLLLDHNLAYKLKKHLVDRICISIDSGIPQEHDDFRNHEGLFLKAMSAIDACVEAGLVPHLHTVVTHQSLYSVGFNEIVSFAKKKELGITVLIAIPAGEWRGNYDSLITEEDSKYIRELHLDYPPLRRDITPINGVDTGCRAVTYALYITASGEVLPCPFLHFTLGNVFDNKLSDILKKGHQISEFREYQPKCLAGEDRDFIDKYVSKTFDCKDLPIEVEKIFTFS